MSSDVRQRALPMHAVHEISGGCDVWITGTAPPVQPASPWSGLNANECMVDQGIVTKERKAVHPGGARTWMSNSGG